MSRDEFMLMSSFKIMPWSEFSCKTNKNLFLLNWWFFAITYLIDFLKRLRSMIKLCWKYQKLCNLKKNIFDVMLCLSQFSLQKYSKKSLKWIIISRTVMPLETNVIIQQQRRLRTLNVMACDKTAQIKINSIQSVKYW